MGFKRALAWSLGGPIIGGAYEAIHAQNKKRDKAMQQNQLGAPKTQLAPVSTGPTNAQKNIMTSYQGVLGSPTTGRSTLLGG